MWKLSRKLSYYVHSGYIFICLIFLVFPITTYFFIDYSWTGLTYKLGYGLLYAICFYLASWIIVPGLIYLFILMDKTFNRYVSITLTICFFIFLFFIIKVYDEKLLDGEFLSAVFSVPIFLWFVYDSNE
jgi:hypothetical protein